MSDDTHATKDEAAADSSGAAEEYSNSNGNGHDSSYSYSPRDDSYSYGPPDRSFSSRGPFEESAKPPFDELPGAGYAPAPAPLPPADALTGSGGFSNTEPASGFDATAGTSLADSEFGTGTAASTDLGPGGYSSAGTGSHGGGPGDNGTPGSAPAGTGTSGSTSSGSGFTGSGYADSGYSDGGYAEGGYADGGYASGTAAAPPYTATFPATPAPTVAAPAPAPALGSQAQHTGLYSYSPPETKSSRQTTSSGSARRANLVISRLEPWSVMKFSFLMSLVAWIVLFVAVALLYYALSSLGVFDSLQKTLASVTSSQGSSGVNLSKWTSGTRVLGYTMLIGAIDVVLITALSTVGAVVYNLVTHLGGGIEITLKETE